MACFAGVRRFAPLLRGRRLRDGRAPNAAASSVAVHTLRHPTRNSIAQTAGNARVNSLLAIFWVCRCNYSAPLYADAKRFARVKRRRSKGGAAKAAQQRRRSKGGAAKAARSLERAAWWCKRWRLAIRPDACGYPLRGFDVGRALQAKLFNAHFAQLELLNFSAGRHGEFR